MQLDNYDIIKLSDMESGPLIFRKAHLNDFQDVRICTAHCMQSDLSFANIYLLADKYGTEICIRENTLYRYFAGSGRLQGFAFPCGPECDIKAALFHIERYAKERNLPLQFCLLTDDNVDFLKQVYGDRVSVFTDRGDADYLYRRQHLAELNGSRFHKKRNHIARFERMNPNCHFEALGAHNLSSALEVAQKWLNAQNDSPALRHEFKAIENALKHASALGIFGGLFYVEHRPVAMTLASLINEKVADIHYEKCIPEYRDAYPMINQAMARHLSVEWINREEDLNYSGLRQAKLSYYPDLILQKSRATVNLC